MKEEQKRLLMRSYVRKTGGLCCDELPLDLSLLRS